MHPWSRQRRWSSTRKKTRKVSKSTKHVKWISQFSLHGRKETRWRCTTRERSLAKALNLTLVSTMFSTLYKFVCRAWKCAGVCICLCVASLSLSPFLLCMCVCLIYAYTTSNLFLTRMHMAIWEVHIIHKKYTNTHRKDVIDSNERQLHFL